MIHFEWKNVKPEVLTEILSGWIWINIFLFEEKPYRAPKISPPFDHFFFIFRIHRVWVYDFNEIFKLKWFRINIEVRLLDIPYDIIIFIFTFFFVYFIKRIIKLVIHTKSRAIIYIFFQYENNVIIINER